MLFSFRDSFTILPCLVIKFQSSLQTCRRSGVVFVCACACACANCESSHCNRAQREQHGVRQHSMKYKGWLV